LTGNIIQLYHVFVTQEAVINDGPTDEIERFLLEARDRGDETLRSAAVALLDYYRSQYNTLTQHKPEDDLARRVDQSLAQLTKYLEGAQDKGRNAWEDVQEQVDLVVKRFPVLHNELPDDDTCVRFHACDQSWCVEVRRKGCSPLFQIRVDPPKE
jgi:hypothetical protein